MKEDNMKQGWEVKKLGEVCEVIGGSTPKTNESTYWDGNYFWVTPAELDGTKLISSTKRTITEAGVKSAHLQLLPAGTVLLSSRAPIGKVAITTVPMYCNQGFKNLICSDKLYNCYAYWFLYANTEYLNALGTGATFKEISKKVVEQIPIPVPPLPVQEQIVSELDLLSGIIEKKREQLKELDALAQSIFYDMFGDPITNEKGWEVKKLGEEFNISSGGTPDTKNTLYWDGGNISWIGSNLCRNEIIYKNDGKYITDSGLSNSSAKIYQEGYVLVALVGATIGKVSLLKFQTATNQNVAGINVPQNIGYTSEFIFYLIQNLYELFMSIGDGKFKMANLSFIRSLPLLSPPLPLQRQFASKIEAIERQKEQIKQSISETETLFNARMQHYFG